MKGRRQEVSAPSWGRTLGLWSCTAPHEDAPLPCRLLERLGRGGCRHAKAGWSRYGAGPGHRRTKGSPGGKEPRGNFAVRSAPQLLGCFAERRHKPGVALPERPSRGLGRHMEPRRGRRFRLARPRLRTLLQDRGGSERKKWQTFREENRRDLGGSSLGIVRGNAETEGLARHREDGALREHDAGLSPFHSFEGKRGDRYKCWRFS